MAAANYGDFLTARTVFYCSNRPIKFKLYDTT